MIADDEVDAFLLSVGNLFSRLDAAVENYNQTDSRFTGIVHTFAGNSVTVFISVGYVIVDIAIELLQEAIDKGNCCASVNVVVAVNKDAFLASKRFVEAVHSLLHILKEEGIVQISQLWTEELSSVLYCVYAASYKHTSKYRADLQLFCHFNCKPLFSFRRRIIAPFVVHC